MDFICMNSKDLAIQEKMKIKNLIQQKNIQPTLAVILVGNNKASETYVKGKEKDCQECGIKSIVYRLDENILQEDLIKLIHTLNNQKEINGILVQLPLPKHINEKLVIESINPNKDVDCFHPINIGKLFLGEAIFQPCTPSGIIDLLNFYNIDIYGKNCVVIGRSNIVGKPIALLLTQLGGTVTICHSATKNLSNYTKQADIIICAVGKPNFITEDMVKNGVTIIDVGINRDLNNKICGDVDYNNVSKKCLAISPVPGGVGLMTRVALLKNTLNAYMLQQE